MSKKKRTTGEEKFAYLLDQELISKYVKDYDVDYSTAKRIIESVFELAKHSLIENGMLSIRGFGTFETRDRKKCRYKNNYTGAIDEIGLTKVVKFLPSRGLKDTLNDKTKIETERYFKKQSIIKQELRDKGIIKRRFR